MPLVSAVSVCPLLAVPLIVGTPTGASLTLATGPTGGRGQRPFGRAAAVGVADLHADLRADIGVAQRVGTGGRAADGRAIAQPLVAEGAQTVGVADAAVFAVSVWSSVGVPLIVGTPLGAR